MARFPYTAEVTPTIFEKSSAGRTGTVVPEGDVDTPGVEELIPAAHLRASPPRLPEIPENEVVRHYTQLSLKNHHVDRALYPLGSCTMKYNPKVNEATARTAGFVGLHPFMPQAGAQGALELMYDLTVWLAEIAGMEAVTLQPAAGAQGEMTGVLLMRSYHESRGDGETRTKVLFPDSAHGTNPATAAMAGFDAVELPSDAAGRVDIEALREALDDGVAGMMLTNPNTLGKFESDIIEICDLVHEAGGLMYMDGANLNALMGVARPGDMGYDIVHFNLHKTMSTPHGGGGPGSGPVAVKSHLAPFLPVPRVVRNDDGSFGLEWDRPESFGKLHGFYGNFGVMVRAWTYMRMLGRQGIRGTAEASVLNNAYLTSLLETHYELPFGRGMHESVFSASEIKKRTGVKTMDIAKRLLDFGFHAPTVYFPLNVPEALMTEPTETETKESLERYAEACIAIANEAESDPERVTTAPHDTPLRRLDEGRAARELDLRWTFESED
ncbi:MAG: aminomethyl-transferring glycine dehydrogenase subunit GcvPB [marine benthic group bacterium]|jgi:glycine dehydrogenase subunit 2|nr:aminomethyl-transferring glycine dehydrogenase subunit GcvPB [Gemmatimonadota bacterium]MCL7961224.1 aminomethyl-transferring glycine dehydrogenase subunit GcvPB [Candidatus Carthagonibacter metallireducens]MCL7956961.1 aminomethyl-transferring glycine dehydrogenase subunit GcvPB [Gemmatimonadota bacterium]MCL7963830.1 aminomethyl-transferring glycine dehydrogenase subunit GcvPB [Gemmatimonadota bacterium]MCL7966855.1 aminomethyl-transferring glycine dehydrogenase subunit GcvPB [Gemmatimonad